MQGRVGYSLPVARYLFEVLKDLLKSQDISLSTEKPERGQTGQQEKCDLLRCSKRLLSAKHERLSSSLV
jgi:hypothetical protein